MWCVVVLLHYGVLCDDGCSQVQELESALERMVRTSVAASSYIGDDRKVSGVRVRVFATQTVCFTARCDH
jgi:hypothetical protein